MGSQGKPDTDRAEGSGLLQLLQSRSSTPQRQQGQPAGFLTDENVHSMALNEPSRSRAASPAGPFNVHHGVLPSGQQQVRTVDFRTVCTSEHNSVSFYMDSLYSLGVTCDMFRMVVWLTVLRWRLTTLWQHLPEHSVTLDLVLHLMC